MWLRGARHQEVVGPIPCNLDHWVNESVSDPYQLYISINEFCFNVMIYLYILIVYFIQILMCKLKVFDVFKNYFIVNIHPWDVFKLVLFFHTRKLSVNIHNIFNKLLFELAVFVDIDQIDKNNHQAHPRAKTSANYVQTLLALLSRG